MHQPDISQVEQRVRRYWYTDGIGELVGGGALILLGVYFGLQAFLGEDSLLTALLQISMVLIFIGGAFAARWLVSVLKTRVTYPRTGYVEYRATERSSRPGGLVVAAVGMAVAVSSVVMARLLGSPDLIVAMTGILLGFILATVVGRASGSVRFYILGGISFGLGVALSYGGLPQGVALAWYYGLMGLAAIISGGLALGRYLRQHPRPQRVADER